MNFIGAGGNFEKAQGSGALLLKLLFALRAQPPNFLCQSCFSKCIDFASNVWYGIAMMNFLNATWLLRSLQMHAI